MNPILQDVLGQIAMAFVMPLVSAAATAIVGWLLWWWQRLFQSEWDAKSREALHAALERGMLVALQALQERRGHAFVTPSNRAELLSEAAAYAEKWSGGTVKRFGLSHADLKELATSHLPMPAVTKAA